VTLTKYKSGACSVHVDSNLIAMGESNLRISKIYAYFYKRT
jgi:hypothetical protein